MSGPVKIAVILPRELLDAAEKERVARGETRNEFFQRALEAVLRQDSVSVEQYVQRYRAHPETEEEVAAAQQAAATILAREPWE